jgi:hypothetical protein
VVLALIGVLCGPSRVLADPRPFAWSYNYDTPEPGETEVEYALTSGIANKDSLGQAAWEHRIELETGISKRLDVAVYQIFVQDAGQSIHYDAMQLRARYRLGEHGKWFVDPILYFEYRRPSNLTLPNVLEGKLILARDIRKVNMALNIVDGIEFAPGSSGIMEYSGGISLLVQPTLRLGAEVFGATAGDEKDTHYLGPTVSVGRDKWDCVVGLGFGLNNKSDDLQSRMLLEIEL